MTKSSLAWQKQAFGCTEEQLRDSIEQSLVFKALGAAGPAMVAMSLLSDAQDLLAAGNYEASRQKMNQAKWAVSTYWLQPGAAQAESQATAASPDA